MLSSSSRFCSEIWLSLEEESRSRSSSSSCASSPLGRRRDADQLEQAVGGVIEHPDRRVGELEEEEEGKGDQQRRPLGLADGDRLRGQLAEHDVQEGDDQEGEPQAHRMDEVGIGGQRGDQRPDQPGERRLADPAETQARERDSQLGRGEVGVEMARHVPRQPGAADPVGDVRLELGRPDADQGELGGHEEAVEDHQDEPEGHPPAGMGSEAGRRRGDGHDRGEGGEQEEAQPGSSSRSRGRSSPAEPGNRGIGRPGGTGTMGRFGGWSFKPGDFSTPDFLSRRGSDRHGSGG